MASCGSDSQPPPREVRDPARRALRPGREELAVTDPEAIPVREARDRSPKSPRWSAGRRASPVWDARRLARRLACRVTCRPNGCLASTRTSLGAPPPLFRVSEAKKEKPGRKKCAAGTRRCCLVLTLSVRHSGRAAVAARAGIHNHKWWVWIPGSQASPAPRNDAEKMRPGPLRFAGRGSPLSARQKQTKWIRVDRERVFGITSCVYQALAVLVLRAWPKKMRVISALL